MSSLHKGVAEMNHPITLPEKSYIPDGVEFEYIPGNGVGVFYIYWGHAWLEGTTSKLKPGYQAQLQANTTEGIPMIVVTNSLHLQVLSRNFFNVAFGEFGHDVARSDPKIVPYNLVAASSRFIRAMSNAYISMNPGPHRDRTFIVGDLVSLQEELDRCIGLLTAKR